MKSVFLFLLAVCLSFQIQAQDRRARLLRASEIDRLFSQEMRTDYGIDSQIYRAYTYDDKQGKFYVILTEKTIWDSLGNPNKDSISAHCLRQKRKSFEMEWAFNAALPDSTENENEEFTLFFMTKYLQLRDVDSNGTVDPIIVYATRAMNGFDDGRIHMFIFNKGERTAIKHQNGVLDHERSTKVDRSFYRLPVPLQDEAKKFMSWMSQARQAIFPYDWEKQMARKKTTLKE